MNIKLISISILVSIAWIVGAYELADTLAHFATQWYWFVLATVYTITLNEIFSHRICSHNLFNVDVESKTYKVLVFLLSVDHAWSPLTDACVTHLNHHMYSDQGDKDNLNYRRHWFARHHGDRGVWERARKGAGCKARIGHGGSSEGFGEYGYGSGRARNVYGRDFRPLNVHARNLRSVQQY